MKILAFTLLLLVAAMPVHGAHAATSADSGQDVIVVAQDECAAIGRRLADERGATLVAASANADGSCEVVLLIPAKDGNRPVREVIRVDR